MNHQEAVAYLDDLAHRIHASQVAHQPFVSMGDVDKLDHVATLIGNLAMGQYEDGGDRGG